MAETLPQVWSDMASFFSTGLSSALETITAMPILVAPTVIGISGIVIGQAKRLIRIGGRRR